MTEGITKGGSVFSNLQQLTVSGHTVFRVAGPGGEHYYYNSRKTSEEVIWLTIESADTLTILEEAIKIF
jgi:hypothetical protein